MLSARRAAEVARRAALAEGLTVAEADVEARAAFARTKKRIERSRSMKPWPQERGGARR